MAAVEDIIQDTDDADMRALVTAQAARIRELEDQLERCRRRERVLHAALRYEPRRER